MGNFQNVTLGTGDFEINGRKVGLTKGDFSGTRSVELLDCESGVPLQIQGRVPIREAHSWTIPIAEFTIENLSDVSLNVPVTTIPGVLTSVADLDDQERTFAKVGANSTQEFIRLDGPNLAAASVVLKDVTETTTYVENVDYFVEYTLGLVFIFVGVGAIASGQTVRVHYDYTPNAAERLQFGVNLPLQEKECIFTHVSPVSGNIFTAFIPRGQFSGTLEANFATEDFAVINATVNALPSAAHPNFPLGYWQITPAP